MLLGRGLEDVCLVLPRRFVRSVLIVLLSVRSVRMGFSFWS